MIQLKTSLTGTFKVTQTIMVVTSTPVTPIPGVTYLEGAQDAINITGLNGDIDQIYSIEGLMVCPATNSSLLLRFNGVSTNVYDTQRVEFGGSYSSSITATQSSSAFGVNSGTNALSQFSMVVDARTGKNRTAFTTLSRCGANQLTVVAQYQSATQWRDNSTNITSINLLYGVAGGYGVGTVIRISTLQS